MENIHQFSERIIKSIKETASTQPEEVTINAVKLNLEYLLMDIFKLLKNIQETSLSEQDRKDRIVELRIKYGIPVNHLL